MLSAIERRSKLNNTKGHRLERRCNPAKRISAAEARLQKHVASRPILVARLTVWLGKQHAITSRSAV